MLRVVLVVLVVVVAAAATAVAGGRGDGTACYRDCSGHGTCTNYQCACDVGFHGEDCAISKAVCVFT